jgi:hypothetical protein
MSVAFDARIRREPSSVVIDIGPDDIGHEIVTEIEDKVLDVELLGDATGIIDIAHRTAPRIRLTAPQLERDTHDLMTVVAEHGCCYRRIDTAGHGNKNLHHCSLTLNLRNWATAPGMTARA